MVLDAVGAVRASTSFDPENGQGRSLGGLIVGVEPAGVRNRSDGEWQLVARFETCVGFDGRGVPFVVGNGDLLPIASGAGVVLGGSSGSITV